MTDSMEVAVTSETSGQLWSVSVWDVNTGAQLMAYKGGGTCGPRTLCFLGGEYIVAAEMTKPLLHVWPVNSSEPSHELRTVCPGIIGALAISPNKNFIVGSIAEKIHVWQVESGRLLGVASRHFQRVTCIRFLEDGSHFVSAGEDGMVLIWCLSHVVSQDSVRLDSVHSFSDHYLPVTDLFIGNGSGKSRLVTVSVDGSCRIYDFASKKLLLSLIFDGAQLTAVTADVTETSLFLGSASGDILSVSLRNPPRQADHHVTEEEKQSVFKGHTKAVTSLSASQDTVSLLSGSSDETVRIWHIESKQCLRIIQHKGSVNNAFLTFIPLQMFADKLKPTIVMHRLQRSGESTISNDSTLSSFNPEPITFSPFGVNFESCCISNVVQDGNDKSVSNEELSAKDKEIDNLIMINSQLFKLASEKIMKQCPSSSSIPSLVDIEVSLQQVDQRSISPTFIYRFGKKMKKNKNSLNLGQ